MASYKELQKLAAKKGIKSVGVSKEDLILALQEDGHIQEEEELENTETLSEDPPMGDAVVYNGKHKVRAYTLEQHGENYRELAEQFISNPDRDGYVIRYETVETRITCPHCGQKFRTA